METEVVRYHAKMKIKVTHFNSVFMEFESSLCYFHIIQIHI